MSGENPCNLCHAAGTPDGYCKRALGSDEYGDDKECMFFMQRNNIFVCEAYDCFINYEGSCMLSLYDDCGCRKYFEGGKK